VALTHTSSQYVHMYNIYDSFSHPFYSLCYNIAKICYVRACSHHSDMNKYYNASNVCNAETYTLACCVRVNEDVFISKRHCHLIFCLSVYLSTLTPWPRVSVCVGVCARHTMMPILLYCTNATTSLKF
jgi:hypothetical protein